MTIRRTVIETMGNDHRTPTHIVSPMALRRFAKVAAGRFVENR
jgi:hypothetical protein